MSKETSTPKAVTSIRNTSQLTYNFIESSGALEPAQWTVYMHLFHHGPCTGSEINKALNSEARYTAYHLRVRELVILGCAAEVGAKPVGNEGQATPLFDVTSRPPDHAKLAIERARIAAQQAQKARGRPSKTVLAKAVPELLAHCREQRDQQGKQFSPEFMALCTWLKTLVPPSEKAPAPAAATTVRTE